MPLLSVQPKGLRASKAPFPILLGVTMQTVEGIANSMKKFGHGGAIWESLYSSYRDLSH